MTYMGCQSFWNIGHNTLFCMITGNFYPLQFVEVMPLWNLFRVAHYWSILSSQHTQSVSVGEAVTQFSNRKDCHSVCQCSYRKYCHLVCQCSYRKDCHLVCQCSYAVMLSVCVHNCRIWYIVTFILSIHLFICPLFLYGYILLNLWKQFDKILQKGWQSYVDEHEGV